MKKIVFFGVMTVLTITWLVTFAAGEWKETEISRYVPLPNKINIIPPDKTLAPETAAFSGGWEGIWNESDRKAVLIVENVNEKEATIILGGEKGKSGFREEGWERHKGKVEGNKIRITASRSFYVIEIQEDLKTIKVSEDYHSGRVVKSTITMRKVED